MDLNLEPTDSPMLRTLKRIAKAGGGIAARNKNSADPFTMWELNMTNACSLISQEACWMTHRQLQEHYGDDDETGAHAYDITVLDYLVKFYIAYKEMACNDRKQAMTGFVELYTYLDTERSRIVYSMYCANYVQAVHCYLYTTQVMGLGIERGIGQQAVEITDMNCIMSQLSDSTRKQVYKELKDAGIMPESGNFEQLKKSIIPFTHIIAEEQRRQLEKSYNN